jgi:tetratricopeptide (TPR) repeat protein
MPLAAALLLVVMTPQDAPPPAPPQVAATEIKAEEPAAAAAIATGQAAFKKRRFRAAQADFEKAVAADPQSAAAAFYLGYTHYKIGEPSRRMNEHKEQARELFAKAFTLDPGFRPDWGNPAPPK